MRLDTVALLTLLVSLSFCSNEKIRHKELVDEINSSDLGWTAQAYEQFDGLTFREVQETYCGLASPFSHLVGSSFSDQFFIQMRENAINRNAEPVSKGIPDKFDSREQWPQCNTIGTIRDQRDCGACWAFSSVECLADRFCIQQNVDVTLSPQHLVNCDTTDEGCGGGLLDNVWWYLMEHGVVTESCVPYQSTTTCATNGTETTCIGSEEPKFYYASSGYKVGPKVEDIQKEVMTNGPVQVSFYVFEDFMTYKSGIYQKKNNSRFVGLHATKLVGWGVEDGNPYWLIANQWGTGWGENGYYRIRRGVDEVGIEAAIAAGMPGEIQSVSEAHQQQKPSKRINVAPQQDDDEGPVEAEDSSAPFPGEFSATGEYVSGLAKFPASWFWSSKKQRQRLDFFFLNHTYTQLYEYDNNTVYWYYGLFDSYICFNYATPKDHLGSGVPSDAKPITATPCDYNTQMMNCTMWQQSYPGSVYLTLITTNTDPSYPVSFTQSQGIGNVITWRWDDFKNSVKSTDLQEPKVDCLPYPGPPVWPPIN